ncbi:MAG: hypothetical protein WCT04_05085 [Planctomycetota bacterium]
MSFLTVSPSELFSLAYLPAITGTVYANDDIINEVAADSSLEHVTAFQRRVVRIGSHAGARDLFKRKIADVGLAVAWQPYKPEEWKKWLQAIREVVRDMVRPEAALHDAMRTAVDAGIAAGDLHLALWTGRNVIPLRTAAPENEFLKRCAGEIENVIKESSDRLMVSLASSERKSELERLFARSIPDMLGAHDAASYKAYCDWMQPISEQLDGLDGAFLTFTSAHHSSSKTDRELTVPTSEPTDTERALLADILNHPDDNELRRCYADCAAKRIDARADLIRVHLEIVANKLDPYGIRSRQHQPQIRAKVLVARHPEWGDTMRHLGAKSVVLHRGFIGQIEIDTREFLKNAAEIFRSEPVQHVRFLNAKEALADLIASPFLSRLNSLLLDDTNLDDSDVAALVASPRLQQVRYLSLRQNHITNAGLEAIAASHYLGALQCLRVYDNPCDGLIFSELYNETDYSYGPTPFAQGLEKKYGARRYLSDVGLLSKKCNMDPDELYATFFYE